MNKGNKEVTCVAAQRSVQDASCDLVPENFSIWSAGERTDFMKENCNKLKRSLHLIHN